MKTFCYLIRSCLLLSTLAVPLSATIVTFSGNAYTSTGTPATSNVRATWGGTDPLLTWDNVILTSDTGLGASECTGSCIPSYTTGSPATVNVSGQTISDVVVAGSNSGAAGNALYVRPVPLSAPSSGARNPEYKGLNAQGAYPWRGGLATAPSVSGGPTISITTLPTGTRSVGFDFGSISNLSNAATAGLTITTTTVGGGVSTVLVPRYDVNQTSYGLSGPGFYGVTSTEDILTITILADQSSTQWILNIANIRLGVGPAATPTPETSTQFTLGAGLITISFLLRKRSKASRGGNA